MDGARHQAGIAAGRISAEEAAQNFADLHPPLDGHEAAVAADRCYFCHDAPCVAACPTGIDIPLFIRQIATGQPRAAAQTIFESNILGGMCARVCPTETLCEEACVRMTAEEKPVEIGRLQRYATDAQMATGRHPFTRAAQTGKRVAVVGAGPAGLACAHRLAMHGHDVVVMDARPKGGGLNEYGIAAYKTTGGFAQAELDWLLQIGGIELRTGTALGREVTLDALEADHDAVFLGIGLGAVNALACEGGDLPGVEDAVDFIARLRQAEDLPTLPVGRRVVVIGGGMTAVDAAVQSRLLGAEEVTIVYRRAKAAMSASLYEQDLAAARGVGLRYNARPVRVIGTGRAEAVEFEYTVDGPDGLTGTGETFRLAADQVLRAIGQALETGPLAGLELDGRKIAVDAEGRTSRAGVWAGGDCTAGGDDLTVTAVAQGRDAAESIHRALMEG
ncbi:NAD(P)-dependent oxidoreductase [Limibaculum sp. M0105]|uniref:NAD(P)-dependent oxidoreductase n=1 Tax=Thermohalobaculum xanthum TaxID=2753746 RepID=A0A8J7SCS2_9RHOB|nr:NAD(P)-dependent oxidoreductase [Thermohalobaculum xanthum]MBK0399617.1 NAD(P)-dependent oxidoreductase [Thermohalobaculum xanthum]